MRKEPTPIVVIWGWTALTLAWAFAAGWARLSIVIVFVFALILAEVGRDDASRRSARYVLPLAFAVVQGAAFYLSGYLVAGWVERGSMPSTVLFGAPSL